MGYRGVIIPDWGRVEQAGIDNPQVRNCIMGALQAFMVAPEHPVYKKACQAFAETGDTRAAEAAMQAFGTTADFPTSVLEVLKKYQPTTYYDTAYEQIFDMRDFTNSNRNGFELLDVEGALSFRLVTEGAKAKVYGMSGEKVTVTFDMYGGGLSWHRRLFDDKEYWTLENNAVEFRNKWYSSKASNFYSLIEAVSSSQNVTWQAVTPANVPDTNENYEAIRDVNTINHACLGILTDVKDKGYGITPNSEFIILAPLALKGRLTRALALVQQPFAGSPTRLYYNVRPLYTLSLSDNTKYYVILPKQKIIGANRMNLTIYGQFDPLSYSDIAVGWGRYAGVIGDTEQVRRCATS